MKFTCRYWIVQNYSKYRVSKLNKQMREKAWQILNKQGTHWKLENAKRHFMLHLMNCILWNYVYHIINLLYILKTMPGTQQVTEWNAPFKSKRRTQTKGAWLNDIVSWIRPKFPALLLRFLPGQRKISRQKLWRRSSVEISSSDL